MPLPSAISFFLARLHAGSLLLRVLADISQILAIGRLSTFLGLYRLPGLSKNHRGEMQPSETILFHREKPRRRMVRGHLPLLDFVLAVRAGRNILGTRGFRLLARWTRFRARTRRRRLGARARAARWWWRAWRRLGTLGTRRTGWAHLWRRRRWAG